MITVTTRIEAILNTRPLTAISTTDIDVYPLRPIDFLQGNVSFSLPPLDSADSSDDDTSYDPDCLQTISQAKEALAFSEQVADKFWDIWNVEYLTALRDTQKSLFKARRHSTRTAPEIGEIVLIEQELIPRGHWPMGIVTEIIQSADGFIRSAKLKLPHKKIYIHRPRTKLYPLEIRATASVEAQEHNEQAGSAQNEDTEKSTALTAPTEFERSRRRPQRAAKTKACEAIRRQQKDTHENASVTDTEQELPRARKPFKISTVLLALMLMTMKTAACSEEEAITCAQGIVTIYPKAPPFEICFNNECRGFNKSFEVLQYVLAPSLNPTEWYDNVIILEHRPLVCTKTAAINNACRQITKPQLWPSHLSYQTFFLNNCHFRTFMTDEIDEEIRLMEFAQTAKLDAIGNTLQIISNRLESLYSLAAEMKTDIETLMERTAPRSPSIFCTITENVDGHHTGRCHRYSDPVTRAMRVAELRLCSRCLRADHGPALYTVSCSICRGSHNTVLCSGTPLRKRKN
uniref:DUF5641 domain-containing protein n=1 Tax=Haemonchus contortus TaxID=6289 RepID=A0A7I4YVX7_HAECO